MDIVSKSWREHLVMYFDGSRDTRKYSGQNYLTMTLGEVFGTAEPMAVDKAAARAIIPSSYCQSAGRAHDAQRERGAYVALTIDIDSGNLAIEDVQRGIDAFVGADAALLIYSSSGATPDKRKWRGMVPLMEPVAHDEWFQLQHGLYRAFHRVTGVVPDYALARSAQPVYLQNVPPERRDSNGVPLFYQSTMRDGGGLDVLQPCVQRVMGELVAENERMAREHDARREAASQAIQRRASSGQGGGALAMMQAFNSANTVASVLESNGYTLRGQSNDWRSPYQSTGSFATRDYGDYWVSLSSSDAAAGIGRAIGNDGTRCFGDAFDLFVHFEHGNNVKEALRTLGREEREAKRDDPARFERMTAADEFAEHIQGEVVAEPVAAEAGSALDEFAEFIKPEPATAATAATEPPTAQQPQHHGITANAATLKAALERIKSASLDELLNTVPDEVDRLRGIDRAGLGALQAAYVAAMKVAGVPIKTKDAADKIRNRALAIHEKAAVERRKIEAVGEAEQSPMLRDWVYIQQTERFYNLLDDREITSRAYDMAYANELPVSDDDKQPPPPNKFFALSGGAQVYARMYAPSFAIASGSRFFSHEGRQYLNSYNIKTTPAHAPGYQQRDAWRLAHDHIMGMMASPQEAETIIQWMAHNVQKPGVKIMWSPVIYGPQGCGKTTIERIMSAAMGPENVRTVGMDEMTSSFTGWAEGACVRFVEEVRFVGHSRHDVMNKLKPYITNDRIQVVRKGQDGVDAINTQNYACFTNFPDALAIDRDDRRYAVLGTSMSDRDDVLERYAPEYWQALYSAIEAHPGDIRAWLMSIDLSGFSRSEAPRPTAAKLAMIHAARSDDTHNVEAVIEMGGTGIASDVVFTAYLNEALRAAGFRTLASSKMRRVTEELGFCAVPWPVKFDGKTCRVSVRGKLAHELATLQEFERAGFNSRLRNLVSEFKNDS